MLRTSLCLLLLLSLNFCVAQFSKRKFSADMPESALYGRINFSGLVDVVDPNISIGAMYLLNEKGGVTLDIGKIFSNSKSSENFTLGGKGQGFFIRPGYRFLIPNRRVYFVDFDFMYKNKYRRREGWFETDRVGNNIVTELIEYKEIKKVFALNAKLGRIFYLNRNRTIFLESYLGVGARIKKFTYNLSDKILEKNPRRQTFPFLENEILPSVQGGVRFCFKIR
jgi:hypothetical protein